MADGRRRRWRRALQRHLPSRGTLAWAFWETTLRALVLAGLVTFILAALFLLRAHVRAEEAQIGRELQLIAAALEELMEGPHTPQQVLLRSERLVREGQLEQLEVFLPSGEKLLEVEREEGGWEGRLSPPFREEEERVQVLAAHEGEPEDALPPEVAAALQGRGERRWSLGEGLRLALPIHSAEGGVRIYGVVQTEASWRQLLGDGILSVLALLVPLVLGAAAGALWSTRAARGLIDPLQALAQVAHRMGQGDLTVRAPEEGPKEIRAVARAFNRMSERLREMIRRERDFSSLAAHELRTPLTAVRARLENLLMGGMEDPQVRETFLQEALQEVERLSRLVDNLLALARAESGQLRLSPTPVLLDELLQQRLRDLDLNHPLEVHLPRRLPPLWADPDLLRQVLDNLLENADKFAPPESPIRIEGEEKGAGVELRIANVGEIPEESLPHLFDRFFRVPGQEKPGSGLGLSIVATLVRLMGGRVHAENRNGWVVFSLWLPRWEEGWPPDGRTERRDR